MRSTSANRRFVGGAAGALVVAVVVVVVVAAVAGRRSPAALDTRPRTSASSRRLGLRLLTVSDPAVVRSGVETLTLAARSGDAEAEVALGRIYLQGLPSIASDPGRAIEWLERAHEAGHPSAAYYRGVMCANGIGGRADAPAAARWFAVAARAGSPHAMFMLGNAYRAGAGVPRDDRRAVALYEQAAEREDAAALQTLAMAYLHGELGLVPDEAESRRYAMEAAHAAEHSPAVP